MVCSLSFIRWKKSFVMGCRLGLSGPRPRETLIVRGVGELAQFSSLVRLSREGVEVDGAGLNGLDGSCVEFADSEDFGGAVVVAIGFRARRWDVVFNDLLPGLLREVL